MFSSGPSYTKLKTNLRLALNRLKLGGKKKNELALKSRKEIANYLEEGKIERARIRVEHIIREDYLVEAMELLEMYCDLLLARFGLIEQMKELDEGLSEAVSSLIWVAPRLVSDVSELKIIEAQLAAKYGKQYALSCKDNSVGTVSAKLMQKMSVQAPPKLLVEKYLIEIAKMYNVEYEPDQKVMNEEINEDSNLIDIGESSNNLDSSGQAAPIGFNGAGLGNQQPQGPIAPGFIGYPYMPIPTPPGVHAGENQFNSFPQQPPPYFDYPQDNAFNYPQKTPLDNAPANYNLPVPNSGGCDVNAGFNIPAMKTNFGPSDDEKLLNVNLKSDEKPKPAPRSKPDPKNESSDSNVLPQLPSVPGFNPSETRNDNDSNKDEIDFDDLTKRFENLKKKK